MGGVSKLYRNYHNMHTYLFGTKFHLLFCEIDSKINIWLLNKSNTHRWLFMCVCWCLFVACMCNVYCACTYIHSVHGAQLLGGTCRVSWVLLKNHEAEDVVVNYHMISQPVCMWIFKIFYMKIISSSLCIATTHAIFYKYSIKIQNILWITTRLKTTTNKCVYI